MCTAVVWPVLDGYVFAFNRDELLSRPPALPPHQRGVFLAPIDPEGGGTWLATNVFGLTLAALNVYEAATCEPEPPVRSRGLLVTDLADEDMANDFNRALRPDGHFGTMSILIGALRRPRVCLPELLRLRNRCAMAARALGDFIADCRF